MAHHYLAPYVGTGTETDPFRPGTDSPGWSAIDLRPDASRPEGWCVLALPVRADPAGSYYFGDSLDTLSTPRRKGIESRLGVTLDAAHLRAILPELLLTHARTDGSRWRPLRAARERWELWLGELVWTQPVVAGGADYSETFNTPDQVGWGPLLTWTEEGGTSGLEVLSNQADIGRAFATGRTTRYGRAEHDTTTSDMYGQGDLTALGSAAFNQAGPCARFSATAQDNYLFQRQNNSGTGSHVLRKTVAGTRTDLGSATTEALALPETLRIECSGSTIVGKIGGVTKHTVTDTTHATGTRGGLYGSRTNNTVAWAMDNYSHGDLAGGTTVVGRSMQAVWNVRATAARSTDLRWNVRAGVARSLAAMWGIRSTVGVTSDLRWGTRATTGRAVSLVWNTWAHAGRALAATWDVRTVAALVLDARWSVRTTAAGTLDTRWSTRTAAGQSLSALWNVSSALVAVGRSLATLWNLRAPVGRALDARWNVRATTARPLDTRWAVRTTAVQAIDARWHVRGTSAKTLASVWSVRAAAVRTLDLRWNVTGAPGTPDVLAESVPTIDPVASSAPVVAAAASSALAVTSPA